MTWTGSAMFQAWVQMMAAKSTATGWGGVTNDTLKAALYNTTPTPDKNAAVASTGYNTGQWVVANEVTDGTNWPAGGPVVTGGALSAPGSGVTMFDATDTPQSGTSTTLSGVFGCLVYDTTITAGTVASQGMSYHYFGGSQSVTAGTFTIVWNANGLWRITV